MYQAFDTKLSPETQEGRSLSAAPLLSWEILLELPVMLAQCTYSEGALFPFAGQAGRVCLMAGLLVIW
jgi:hypothetical protein